MRARGSSAVMAVLSVLSTVAPGSAQSTFVGLSAARSTYDEVAAENRQEGFGVTGSAGLEWGKLSVEAELNWRSLSPSVNRSRNKLTLRGGGVRSHYAISRLLDVEVGLDTRVVSPEFSAQDAALVTVGLRHESALSSLASIWIRGGAIPVSRFNGGGSGGIGLVLGFGVRAGPPSAAWRAVAVYDFQRIDRTVRDVEVPIQYEGLRLGFEYSVF